MIRKSRTRKKTKLIPNYTNEDLTVDNFDSKLGISLNIYQRTYDAKDSKQFLIDFKPEIKKHVDALTENQFFHYTSLGFTCKFLIDNNIDQFFHKQTGEWIDTKIQEIVNLKKEKKERVFKKGSGHDIQLAMLNQVREKIGNIDQYLDDFVFGRENKLDVIAYIKNCGLSPMHVRKIYNIYQKEKEEYMSILGDKEMEEAYRFLNEKKIKKVVSFYDDLLEKLDTFIKLNSTRRKKKTKKPSVAKLVSKVNYLKESESLGIVSISPDKIIGSQIVVLFNEKTKKITILNAADRSGLQIKGTTIYNYDNQTSLVKGVRSNINVQEFIQEIASKPRTTIKKMFDGLTTKESPATGRINGDTLIIKIF